MGILDLSDFCQFNGREKLISYWNSKYSNDEMNTLQHDKVYSSEKIQKVC